MRFQCVQFVLQILIQHGAAVCDTFEALHTFKRVAGTFEGECAISGEGAIVVLRAGGAPRGHTRAALS